MKRDQQVSAGLEPVRFGVRFANCLGIGCRHETINVSIAFINPILDEIRVIFFLCGQIFGVRFSYAFELYITRAQVMYVQIKF